MDPTQAAETSIPVGTPSLRPYRAALGVAALVAFVVSATARFITVPMIIASINFFVLQTGFAARKADRRVHGALMAAGILSDLALVLTLQIKRHAIQTALEFKLSALNQAHIYCSTAATALYIPMLVLGAQLLFAPKRDGGASGKPGLHRRLGFATMIFRTLGYVLMFSMLSKPA